MLLSFFFIAHRIQVLDAESLLMEAIDAQKNDEVEDTVEVGFSVRMVRYLYTNGYVAHHHCHHPPPQALHQKMAFFF